MTPTITDLKKAMAGVITLSDQSRIQALKNVISWYESAIPFFRPTFGPDEESKYQKAMKSRNLGHGGMSIGEQETALRMSIRLFERCLDRLGVVKVEDAYRELDTKRGALEAAAAKAEQDLAPLLSAFRAAYQGLGLTFSIDPQAATNRQVTLQKSIVYHPDYLRSLMTKVPGYSGVLPAVLTELESCLKATSLEADAMGAVKLKASTFVGQVKPAVEGLLAWLAGNPQAASDPIQQTTTATPKPAPSPKPTPAPTPAHRSGSNPYRGMKGAIFEALLLHQNTRVHLNTIMLGLQAKDPRRMLAHIADDGAKTHQWVLTVERSGWLTFTLN